MADFMSRLLMDSSGYVKGLNDAKKAMLGFGAENKNFSKIAKNAGQSTDNFAAGIGKAGPLIKNFSAGLGKAGPLIGQIAAGLGLAVSSGEAFKKLMSSSQTLSDMVDRSMQALNTTVDEFFYSLGSGNFDGFLGGLDNIINKAKDAYDAMDQLGNTEISYGVISSINKSQIADAQYVAKNKFAPNDDREKAFGQWRGALQNEMQSVEALRRELNNATVKTVESRVPGNLNINMDDIVKAFQVDLMDPEIRAESKARAARGIEAFDVWDKAHSGDRWNEERQKNLEGYKWHFTVHSLLEKYNDEELKGIAAKITQYYNLNESLKSVAREYNETATEFNNSNKEIKDFKPVESLEGYTVYTGGTTAHKDFKTTQKDFKTTQKAYKAGSIAAINEEIKQASTLYAEATSDAARVAALKTLNELKKQKFEIEFVAKHPNKPDLVKEQRVSFASMAEVPDINKPFENTDSIENWTNKINESSQTLEGLGSIMGTMGGIASQMGNNVGAALLQGFGNIISLIPQIQALTTAQAAAGASKLPFPASLVAIGSVFATVAGLFASLSYADGGIVPGSNFHDGIRANVSSGEMFINQHDQSNLFRAIKTGNFGGGGSFQPYIQGEQIYFGMRHYMKRTGKKAIILG